LLFHYVEKIPASSIGVVADWLRRDVHALDAAATTAQCQQPVSG
jgi:hypothetical protein